MYMPKKLDNRAGRENRIVRITIVALAFVLGTYRTDQTIKKVGGTRNEMITVSVAHE